MGSECFTEAVFVVMFGVVWTEGSRVEDVAVGVEC